MQYSVAVRNAKLDAIANKIGGSPMLRIWDGTLPKSCLDPDNGNTLAKINLPPRWLGVAADGAVSKVGTWSDYAASRSGTPRYFRIYGSGGACAIQGEIGRDMKLNSSELRAGQVFTVKQFTIRDANG